MRKDPGLRPFIVLVILILTGTAAYSTVPADAAGLESIIPAGSYQIDSAPQGAEVYQDGQFIGESPVTITVYPTSPPGHTITLSLAGYQPWTRTYSRNPDPGQVVRVYATLQPIQEMGSLIVSSTPGGALVTLDGGHGQMTPWTYTDLTAGAHVVQLFLSGYQTYTAVITVPQGGIVPLTAVLLPLTNVGVLQVISTPGGADLYVDQVYSGVTATTVGNLQNGEHQVTLRLAGYQDWKGSVPVKGGATTTITPTALITNRTALIRRKTRDNLSLFIIFPPLEDHGCSLGGSLSPEARDQAPADASCILAVAGQFLCQGFVLQRGAQREQGTDQTAGNQRPERTEQERDGEH